MEAGKKKSFATDLFGEKDKPTPSPGSFGSIFAPPSEVSGREAGKKSYENSAWNPKTKGVLEGEGEGEGKGSYYQQEQKPQPFHYSSSIYYGGQDFYERPPQAPEAPVFTTFKDGSEDDSAGASRGNWWRGSLYY